MMSQGVQTFFMLDSPVDSNSKSSVHCSSPSNGPAVRSAVSGGEFRMSGQASKRSGGKIGALMRK
jgi:hypothetical protein